MISATDALRPAAADVPPGMAARAAPTREFTYAWDLETDALQWAADAAGVLGLSSMAPLATGRLFAARLVAESVASREKVILTGAADPGTGVAYRASYGLIVDPDDRDAPVVWLDDRGRWYAGLDGRPARAEGRIRRIALDVGVASADSLAALVDRPAFLDHVARKLAALGRAPTPFALLVGGFVSDGRTEALAAVVDVLRVQMRARDVLAHLAPDRLALLLEACNAEQTVIATDRLQSALAAADLGDFRFGGAVVPRDGRSAPLLFTHAEDDLAAARA